MGDGNFHCLVAVDFDNAEEVESVKTFSASLARFVKQLTAVEGRGRVWILFLAYAPETVCDLCF